ncbi:MAG: hypothetical protein ACLSS9_08685 [Acutalibacteraceae bacterium]|jgi:hypothetical protein
MENILQEITPEQFTLLSQNTGVTEEEMTLAEQTAADGPEVQNG